MFFYLLLVLPIVIGVIVYLINDKYDRGLLTFVWFILSGIPCYTSTAVSFMLHAEDLARVFAQQEVIEVYEKEVDILVSRLDTFNYPRSGLMNNDTPVATLVTEISKWQAKLSEARSAEALAKRSIEQRRYGLMSGVISIAGDYK